MCYRLPAYHAKVRVRERKLPKLYWCDPGIVRAMKHSTGVVAPEEKGALFEGLVGQVLRAYKDYRALCEEVYYWAPAHRSTAEVDFLLIQGSQIVAIEAKSGNTFAESWCKGVRALAELPGVRRRIVVYPKGPVLRTSDGIDVFPFQHFADLLAAGALNA